jgi:two-component system phosphate regulon response regulator PhoB
VAATKSILIVEDEKDLADLIRYNLEREGYDCRAVNDGSTALAEVRRKTPDLIVLDRMLPGISGDDVMSQLKREAGGNAIPVIILTAKVEDSDQLVGFALGADDYVTKPFSMKLLVARVAAVFRRTSDASEATDVISSGPFKLDSSRFELTVGGKSINLTATEFRVFKALMAAGGRVLSRSDLIDMVLGRGVAVTDRTIDVHITAVRKKLGESANWVQTIRGVGYTFREPA